MGRWLGFSIPESAWPILAFLVLAAVAHVKSSRWMTLSCVGLAIVFAGALAEAWHRPGSPPEIDAGSRETVILEGCVVEPTVFAPEREQFTLELDPGARARVSLPLGDDDTPQRLEYGQRVEIEARVRRPRNYNNPGSFDYAGYLARQKIYWTAAMAPGSVARVLPGRCGSRLMGGVFALRVATLDRIERLYGGNKYSTGMMEAILIGESSKLEKVWTENFRRTGTFHALVISGVHVTVLAGVLLFLLRLCAVPEFTALTLTAGSAWLYALVSGLSAPVVRAAGGFTLYLVARFFFRKGRVLNLLAAIALVYLLWDPGQLFDASFQLSFLCVAAIGALATPLLEATSSPLARGLRSISDPGPDPYLAPRAAQFRIEVRLAAEALVLWTRLPQRMVIVPLSMILRAGFFAFEMAVISTVVQVGLALPMAEYFHRVSFSGLTANVLIVPLLEAVVPIGFVAVFTGWHWVGAVAGWMLTLSARVADWHAGLEPSWRVPDPPVLLAIVFVASLVCLGVVARNQTWRLPAAATVLLSFGLLLWHPWPPAFAPHMLELTAIDVGQGDSLLVVFPGGKRMLIDGGGLLQFGRRRRSNLDTGEDVVSPYLWNRGIRHIDVVVATHAHEDHSGGLGAIVENFHPRELWTGASPLPALLERAARFHVIVKELRAGAPFELSGTSIEILSPPVDYSAPNSGNNDSLAFRIVYGERSFLLTGDMERPMEARLLSDHREIRADVLKVGHHGSRTSTIQPFLDLVSPSVAIISDGFENSFGHPHKDVVTRLAIRHTAVLRTDMDGLISVLTDGRRLIFNTNLWQGGSPWWTGEHSLQWPLSVD
jgi:competence protein ComEC